MEPSFSAVLSKAFAISPSDTVPVNAGHGTKAVMCTANGNAVVKFQNDTATSITLPVVAGQTYPWNLRMVYIATTATLIGFL